MPASKTAPLSESRTCTCAIPLFADSRASSGISGTGAAAFTAAGALGVTQPPALDVGTGLGEGVGVAVAVATFTEERGGPALLRTLGTKTFVVRAAFGVDGAVGSGAGVCGGGVRTMRCTIRTLEIVMRSGTSTGVARRQCTKRTPSK